MESTEEKRRTREERDHHTSLCLQYGPKAVSVHSSSRVSEILKDGLIIYPRKFRRGERDDRFKQVSQTRTAREADHVNSFFLIISRAVEDV